MTYRIIIVLSFLVITAGCISSDTSINSTEDINTKAEGETTRPETTTEQSTPLNKQPIESTPVNPPEKISPHAEVEDLNVTRIEYLIFTLINSIRENQTTSSLLSDERLAAIARSHSFNMAFGDFYSHVDPKRGGPARRLNNLEYDCPDKTGENIHTLPYNMTAALGNETYDTANESEIAEYIVDSWNQSLKHRQIMLDPEYEVTGVGIYVSEKNRLFVTAEFCG